MNSYKKLRAEKLIFNNALINQEYSKNMIDVIVKSSPQR